MKVPDPFENAENRDFGLEAAFDRANTPRITAVPLDIDPFVGVSGAVFTVPAGEYYRITALIYYARSSTGNIQFHAIPSGDSSSFNNAFYLQALTSGDTVDLSFMKDQIFGPGEALWVELSDPAGVANVKVSAERITGAYGH